MHVTLFTPDSSYDQFRDVWMARIAMYAELLAPHGIALEPVSWPTARPVRPALSLLSWGYHLQPARWDTMLQAWPDEVLLLNPPSLLRWNSDKRYLSDLEAAGVAVVPTVFADIATGGELEAARAAFEADELVVKPRISASASSTSRVGRGDAAPNLADAMIQPFMPSVQDEGELSIFFFGGERAHAVRKVAAPGDFRVQREYGGTFTVVEPNAAETSVAQRALAAAPGTPFYARVDLVPDPAGQPRLMELELIEPDLYLDLAPDRGASFAAALTAELRSV
jgi:glutathione synthase/RimK-type ligase-like ATP-grasp enzyme